MLFLLFFFFFFFFFQAEDGIRDIGVTGVQTCALPIWVSCPHAGPRNPHLMSACDTVACCVVVHAANNPAHAPTARNRVTRLTDRVLSMNVSLMPSSRRIRCCQNASFGLLGARCSAISETTSMGLTSIGPWSNATYRLPVDIAPRSHRQEEIGARSIRG